MKNAQNYLYAKDAETLQVPYADYTALMKKVEEAQCLQQVKATVLADLQKFVEDAPVATRNTPPVAPVAPVELKAEPKMTVSADPVEALKTEKISVEFTSETPEVPKAAEPVMIRTEISDVPPVKKDIIGHFNKLDESGRLLNVFKQYYTCLNENCGGTVRVTMKDGFCSLWNYDEWEEFAFVDIFENLLRITIDPRYTEALKSLNLCEAPRLISSRRNVVSVQVDGLNNIVLETLAKAFAEVGMQIK